ncbi:MAG: hypothetical protein NTZ57_07790, partial [Deltaproteobacteria bacterium]|nr:hypothetical protein [Deltaproteobacteria bacterium]
MATQESKVLSAELQEDPEQIEKYDPEMRFRKLAGLAAKLVFVMTIILSIFHIYTAGFGVLQELRHRAFHLSFVLPLVFFVYSIKKGEAKGTKRLIFDVIYAITGSAFMTAIFRELLGLSVYTSAALAVGAFALIFYFKSREELPNRLTA